MDANHTLAQQWLDTLAAERGIAPGTRLTYGDDLACYLGFLAGRPLTQVDRATIQAYLEHLTELGLAPSTSARRRSVARSLHRFLVAEEIAPEDPTLALQPGKRIQRLPVVLTIAQVDALLETAHRMATDGSVGAYRQAGYARRAALLETLYASGMRVSEAVTLPLDAFRRGQRYLFVKGKGGKERLVPLHGRAIQAIEVWQKALRAYRAMPSKWLFHAVRSPNEPLSRQAAWAEIRETAVAAGLPRPDLLSPHKLRHAFATHLLENGANLREIQELLGHADLGSTEVYTHVASGRLRSMVKDLHPLNDAS
jgi:integrase/recombinase XerD